MDSVPMETSESLIEKAVERLTKSGDSDVRRDANRRSPTDLDRPQAENTFYLRDIVGVLRERWLLFLLVLGLVAAPGVWLVMSLEPTYVATSQIIIEPNERMRLTGDSEVSGITLDNESVRSEVEVLTSPDLAQRVVDRLLPRVTQDLESKKIGVFLTLSNVKKQLGIEGTAVEPPLVQRFLKRLTVTPVERSRVISVSYRAYDAELAAEVANTIVSEYVDMALELKRQGTREAAEWLAGRMAELQRSIDASERSIENYRKQTGLIQGNGNPLVAERLNHANLALAQARSRMAAAVARLSQLGTANAADKMSEVLKSPVIQKLRGLEAELATRVAELSTTTGDASPHLVTARNSLARVRLSISEEIARIQQNLRKETESVGALQDGLQQEVESLKRELSELQTASIGLRVLEREAEANRAIYENVLLRTKNVVAQESFLRRDARVIGHALAPVKPASLSSTLLVIACLAAGLIASAAVIRVVVHFEPGFSRVRDIERATGISVLSAVPKIRFSRQQSFDNKAFDEQRSRFAGSIDMLLGRIMIGKSGGRGIVLTVTSCLPGEGKTTVTLALAHLAARIGYKCLVIDGDFCRSRITRSLGLQASSGLADVLAHSRKLDEVTTQLSDTALYVLPAGHSTHGIGRLLGSDSFRSMIHGLTHEYDLIIIDSSPLMAAAEPQILAHIADQTLMVVRWKKTPRATIQDAIERLSKATGVICSIALSQVNSGSKLKYYGDA